MTYAVFGPDRQPLAIFSEDPDKDRKCAERALAAFYRDQSGTFVDGFCVTKGVPSSDCDKCSAQLACGECRWPDRFCAQHL